MSRCTGHCCKRFYLPYDKAGLDLAAERDLKAFPEGPPNQIDVIATMVIPFEGPDILRDDSDARAFFYTCKHHDEATGNCMNYENRPTMCSSYPYERECSYQGCTMKCDTNNEAKS